MWDPGGDAWLAGFTDGEGSFQISASGGRHHGRRPAFAPRFAIGLHSADAPILYELQRALGGSVALQPVGGAIKSPRATWTVASRRDLRALIDYFDRFTLRARKARDYAVWRQAVLLYLTGRPAHELHDPMLALREALMSGRAGIDADVETEAPPQLRLVEAG